MPNIDLVIFDCDGVLIDSEPLSAAAFIAELQRQDIDIPQSLFFERMIGRSFEQAVTTIYEVSGKVPHDGFKDAFRSALLARFETSLQPIKGIEFLLQQLVTSVCVATSSDPVRAARSLALTGLDHYFGTHVFTASMVQNGKPAPDLFLHAAEQFSIKPERCLVIEDSGYGLMAAKAAGMQAWHFTGGGHFSLGYSVPEEIPRDRTFKDMANLLKAAEALGLVHPSS